MGIRRRSKQNKIIDGLGLAGVYTPRSAPPLDLEATFAHIELVAERERARLLRHELADGDSQPNEVAAAGVDSPERFGVYLAEISRGSALSSAEELRLAEMITEGRSAERLLTSTDPNVAERASLERTAALGEKAEADLLKANLGLVVALAKIYEHPEGLPFVDLIQEGNLGLLHAVRKFDHTRGYRFSAYATWWIRTAFKRFDHDYLPPWVDDFLDRLTSECAPV